MTKHNLLIQALAVAAMGATAQLTAPSAHASVTPMSAECGFCVVGCPAHIDAYCHALCPGSNQSACPATAGGCSYGDGSQPFPYAVLCYTEQQN